MVAFPDVVVPQCLRDHHADLRPLTDRELIEHWVSWGEKEGRVGSPAALREHFLPLAKGAFSLEVGPFNCPALRGDSVRYLDVLDASALKSRAIEIGLDATECPETIHYANFEQVEEVFDVVLSSHNIEHHPDFIGHLNDVERVLKPDGVFMVIIPDKRYCFDHFLPESSIADILEARSRKSHTLKSVIEHLAMTGHNETLAYWEGRAGPAPDPMARLEEALNKFEDAKGAYIDVHAWQFTPRSFEAIVSMLSRLGLTSLRPHRVYATPYGRHEFTAVLSR